MTMSISLVCEAEAGELSREPHVVLDPIDPNFLFGVFFAAAGVDEDVVPAGPDQQAVKAQPDPVLFVRRGLLLPQDLGDHAEHRPAVEPDIPIRYQVQVKLAEFQSESSSQPHSRQTDISRQRFSAYQLCLIQCR